jgi:hypothetical protein
MDAGYMTSTAFGVISTAEPVLLIHSTLGVIGEYPTRDIGIQGGY